MPEDVKKLADLKNACAYREPPQDLIAATAGYVQSTRRGTTSSDGSTETP